MTAAAEGAHEHVREAMVREPLSLDVDATAQEAGEALSPADVRAVFVLDAGHLVGVVTRKTLVREVVATGRDPRATHLRDIAEPPLFTIDAGLAVEEAFRLLFRRHTPRLYALARRLLGPRADEAEDAV